MAVAIHYSSIIVAQEIPISAEQQLENLTDATEEETEDDTYLQDLEQFRKNPINLNTADADELKQLRVLTDLQIVNLVLYRNLLGRFIHIYELQAVPAWDVFTIRKIIPFVVVDQIIIIMIIIYRILW